MDGHFSVVNGTTRISVYNSCTEKKVSKGNRVLVRIQVLSWVLVRFLIKEIYFKHAFLFVLDWMNAFG